VGIDCFYQIICAAIVREEEPLTQKKATSAVESAVRGLPGLGAPRCVRCL